MTKRGFRKYKFYVWFANLIIFLVIILLLIIGVTSSTLSYIFNSEQFTAQYLYFLGAEKPLIDYIIVILLFIVFANLEVYYRDRKKHERETGVYKKNERKRELNEGKLFYWFIVITFISFIFTGYLFYYGVILHKISFIFFDIILTVSSVLFVVGCSLSIGYGVLKIIRK